MNIARFEKRIWAYIIDILFASLFPAAALILAFMYVPGFLEIPFFFLFLMFIFAAWFFYTLIFTLWLAITNGRTLGGLIFGLRVVHPDISRLSFGDCFARSAAQGVIVMVFISIIYVLAMHTEKSVFDRLSNTIVADWRNRSI